MLADALAGAQVDEHAAVGICIVAQETAESVRGEWETLEVEWAAQMKADASRLESFSGLPQKLEAAFENLAGQLELAAACVRTLATANKQRAELSGRLHAKGIAEGYDDFAGLWASEILMPGDVWRRPGNYRFSKPESEVAA